MLSTAASSVALRFRPFHNANAAAVASWVDTRELLRWVAPSQQGPLTAAKVLNWVKPGGEAFVLVEADTDEPVAYGELNPMRAEPDHYWVGHIVVRSMDRGRGTGGRLVRELLAHAFGELSAGFVSLVVFPNNKWAIRCYNNAGMKIMGEEFHRLGGKGPYHRLVRLQIDREGFRRHAAMRISCASSG